MEKNINNAVKEAIENAPERKFVESMDIQFTIKDVDLKNPTNRIKEEVRLPSGRGRDVRIAMFAAGEAATRAREAGIHVITPPEIEELGGNKGRAKKVGNQFDFFLSEVPHMGSSDDTSVQFSVHEEKCLVQSLQHLTQRLSQQV
jgi:large subunit ribosomal protein L1